MRLDKKLAPSTRDISICYIRLDKYVVKNGTEDMREIADILKIIQSVLPVVRWQICVKALGGAYPRSWYVYE